MTSMMDLQGLENSFIDNEKQFAIDLKDGGINIEDLRLGKETNFEIDPSSIEDEETSTNTYFDQESLFKELNYECLDDGADSGDEKSTPFDKLKKDMSELNKGVLKKIIKHGAGPVVPSNSLCRVHYNAYVEYSDEPFDSSRLRGRQHQFKLGSGESILGWEVGVATMKRGEISRFIFSHEYGFGKMGCPPRIPPEAETLFEIELISFVDQGAADEFENFSEEERKRASFDQILKVAESVRSAGNEAFKLNQVGRAASKYSQALRLLENSNLKDEAEEKEMKKEALKLYLNISLCDLKQGKPGNACRYARKALDVDPKNVKAFYRLARGLRRLGELEEAKKTIGKAHRLDPSNKDVMDEFRSLDNEIKSFRKRQQDLDRKMVSALSSMVEKKPIKKDTKFIQNSQMLNIVIDRLKTFQNENTSSTLILPSNLTDEEMTSLEDFAQNMNLIVTPIHYNGKKSIEVSKVKEEEEPYR